MNPVIELRDASRIYPTPQGGFSALSEVNLSLHAGELVAVVGKSGSGKSTLVNLIAGIDRPTSGEVHVAGTAVHTLRESALSAWRGRIVGVVFQFFQLLPTLTIAENVLLPIDFCGTVPAGRARARVAELLARVGIADQASKLPAALSGGQQQRAAIEAILDLLSELARQGKTIVTVTHERDIAKRADRVVMLVDGRVAEVTARPREVANG
jgi:putative ABC transport system ATP-binding protein